MPSKFLRNIPPVNELLESPPLQGLVNKVSHNVVADGIRTFLDNLRTEVQNTKAEMNLPTVGELAENIAHWILNEEQSSLRPVINATGIILHTGLGRAPLPAEAIQDMTMIAAGYASVEVNIKSGERSQRVEAVEQLLTGLTGAEAAVVVNNNAGATLLVLAALAHGREAIVSRGELIEIGGSFRLPDVMETSGAKLKEVGTTNKTRIEDYANAIGENTAAIMRVHTSNFVVEGFTEHATLAEMVALAKKNNLPLIDDIGSGALVDFSNYGLPGEPIAAESIDAGADVVLFSGDKLIGGPQCGILVGRKTLIQKIVKHPLMRALRVDKITLAALAATLRLYRDLESAEEKIPLLTLLNCSIENLRNRAERLAAQIQDCNSISEAIAVEDSTFLGGGSVPTQKIPTYCIAITPATENVDAFAAKLRNGTPAVFGRIQQNRFLLDLRSVLAQQDLELLAAVQSLENA